MGSAHLHCFLPRPLFILSSDEMSQALLLPINSGRGTRENLQLRFPLWQPAGEAAPLPRAAPWRGLVSAAAPLGAPQLRSHLGSKTLPGTACA